MIVIYMKAIIMNNVSEFSWTMKRPFYFETHDTMENVVQAMESLKRGDFSGKPPNTLTLSSTSDGYRFHYEARRWDKNYRASSTAYGDGSIRQRDNGTVVVEGTAHIDPWGFYGAVLVAVLATFVTAITTSLNIIICVLLAIGVIAVIFFVYSEDLNRVSRLISQALSPDSYMA
jgi:hypothetical protein